MYDIYFSADSNVASVVLIVTTSSELLRSTKNQILRQYKTDIIIPVVNNRKHITGVEANNF